MLNLIMLSVKSSHQYTSPILLYKRRLCTDEASGMGILVAEDFIGTTTKCSLFIHYNINGSLTDSSAYELRSIWRPLLISCTFPSPCYWLHTANCDNASATGVALVGPCLRRACCSEHGSHRRHPPLFSLTAWRPHPNDKAASPASRVQQP